MNEVPDHDSLAVGADIGGSPVRDSLEKIRIKIRTKKFIYHSSPYNTATAFGLQQSAQASTARV
jgi:hypothetical protein